MDGELMKNEDRDKLLKEAQEVLEIFSALRGPLTSMGLKDRMAFLLYLQLKKLNENLREVTSAINNLGTSDYPLIMSKPEY